MDKELSDNQKAALGKTEYFQRYILQALLEQRASLRLMLVNACLEDPRLASEIQNHAKKLLENSKLPKK
jgi:hypothetical protein